MGVWGFGLVNNGFYFAEDEDTMAEDTEDRSGSLEVEDDDVEDDLVVQRKAQTPLFMTLHWRTG